MNAKADAQRLRLIRVAQDAGLPVREVLRLAREEFDTLSACTDAECLAYTRALLAQTARRAGHVPAGWTRACHCSGCGLVWLWPEAPAALIACPWCWNRVAGLPVPSAQLPL